MSLSIERGNISLFRTPDKIDLFVTKIQLGDAKIFGCAYEIESTNGMMEVLEYFTTVQELETFLSRHKATYIASYANKGLP